MESISFGRKSRIDEQTPTFFESCGRRLYSIAFESTLGTLYGHRPPCGMQGANARNVVILGSAPSGGDSAGLTCPLCGQEIWAGMYPPHAKGPRGTKISWPQRGKLVFQTKSTRPAHVSKKTKKTQPAPVHACCYGQL